MTRSLEIAGRSAIIAFIVVSISIGCLAQSGDSLPEDYARTLALFSEKALPADEDAYRIVVWPIFQKPLLITISKTGSGAAVVAKTLSGQGGYRVGGIDSDKSFAVSGRAFKKIERAFANARLERFRGRDTRWDVQADGTVMICLDGASWVIERVVAGEYLYVERLCPEEKELIDVGYSFLKTSKLNVSKKELF